MSEFTAAGESAHRAFALALKPPPALSISEWADKERQLSPESSAEPGQWRTSRIEYMREIMNTLNDPAIVRVVVQKAAQVGYTETINNVLGFYMDTDPAPVLIVQPTLEMAEAWSKDRLSPMLRDTPVLAGKVRDHKSRDSDNTIRAKVFPGGRLTIIGANAPAGLSARPIRIVLGDEVDRWPVSAGTEGDPLALASKRQQTFWNRRTLIGSTPVLKITSVIAREYAASDQRRYYVPCPHCEHEQTMKWQQVQWTKSEVAGGHHIHHPESACYVCENCGACWTEVERHAAVKKGRWIAENPGGNVAGFHIPGFLSPWLTLEEIAREFLKAGSDPSLRQVWENTVLGMPFEEAAEKIDSSNLIGRGESYTPESVPAGVVIVTAGVDTQADRLEMQVVGWGVNDESWLIAHEIIHGDPSALEIWDELDQMLLVPLRNENGRELRIQAACIDTGGHHGAQVHAFCRQRRARRIFPTKGFAFEGTRDIWPRSAVKTHDKRSQVFLIGVSAAKELLYGRLRISKPGAGYVHFPVGQGCDQEFFKQLVAEHVITRKKDGRPFRKWVLPPGRHNEALDCYVMALAARLSLKRRLVEPQEQTIMPPQPILPEELTMDETPTQSTPPAPAAPLLPLPNDGRGIYDSSPQASWRYARNPSDSWVMNGRTWNRR
jgi:phage terminase large subunit GpA-like protein